MRPSMFKTLTVWASALWSVDLQLHSTVLCLHHKSNHHRAQRGTLLYIWLQPVIGYTPCSRSRWRCPDCLTCPQNDTLSCSPPSALRMLEEYVDLQPGDAVIQNGANSAVGQVGRRVQSRRTASLIGISNFSARALCLKSFTIASLQPCGWQPPA